MSMDHRGLRLESVRAGLSLLLYPLQLIADLPTAARQWTDKNLSTRDRLLKENQRLSKQQLKLKVQLNKFAAVQAENIRLKQLLNSAAKLKERVLVARLLAVDMDPNRQQILIDKGMRQGVFIGQPLLDGSGIVGQIVHAGPLSANAILITDISHALPVQVNRNGIRTLAVGSGLSNRLTLPYLPNNSDIRVGDLLVSSGLGGRFPPDYSVGRITAIGRDPGRPFADVRVAPSAKLDRSREVLLLWPFSKQPAQPETTGSHVDNDQPHAETTP